jgi:PAS domain S-box-containing protein
MAFSLNKILRLQIRGKLAIAFVGLSLLPVLVVGLLVISANIKSLKQIAIENLDHDLLIIKERLSVFFHTMEENIHTIAASSSFDSFLQTIERADLSESQTGISDVLDEVIAFAERKGVFYQIKYINSDGEQIFHIEDNAGAYRQLLGKAASSGTQFYLYLSRNIPENKATFLPVELKMRNQEQLIPGISCIYPVFAPDFRGVLVFQIYARHFFDVFEDKTLHNPSSHIMLVSREGYYLYHSEKKKDWNQLLASKEQLNLRGDYGNELADRLLQAQGIETFELEKEILISAPLFSVQAGLQSAYAIMISVSKPEIFAPVDIFKRLLVALLGFYLLTSLTLAYFATQQFTQPIKRLKREAEVIAKGDYEARVDIRTYDEIEDLAQQFNVMADSLEQREYQIAQHRQQLEQKVRERTHELQEEKDKLKAILDNVPSAFVLLDKEYRILAASAMLQTFTGKSLSSVIGSFCYEVLGDGHSCEDCPSQRTFKNGKMETRQVQRVNRHGEMRHLEHTAIPLGETGKAETVLEIITDITERKQLQEQVIRSERLAATGELAAVIAHEMRNSLTSVRMILQLLTEGDRLSEADGESLFVALDSLAKMERVVNDLLQLARPAELQRKLESLNDIIKESIEFARHQITKEHITVNMKLGAELPTLLIDREQMKEALVNLVLNASQAIQGSGRVLVKSCVKTLPRPMRGVGEVRVLQDEKTFVEGKEIFLHTGQTVIYLEIEDSGCGILPQDMAHIFNPFFTTKADGTGLGLSFVKRVVNEHGGIISVQSEINSGTRFAIFLPIEV